MRGNKRGKKPKKEEKKYITHQKNEDTHLSNRES